MLHVSHNIVGTDSTDRQIKRTLIHLGHKNAKYKEFTVSIR